MASASPTATVPAIAHHAEHAAGSRRVKFGFWFALLACFLAEFLLFDQIGAKRHTVIYPRWNDQIQYLTESYLGCEYLREHGFATGLWHALVNPSAQGTLHDFCAILIFSVTGPSRSDALSLNILALIGWPATLAFAVMRRSRSAALAWVAAALPLTLSGLWKIGPGSTADFRLDHFGVCALGITLASVMCTDGFHSLRGSVCFGVSVGLTLLVRFITGPYFVVIFVALALWLLCTPTCWRRIGHLLLAGVVATAVALPIFWLNRELIWTYYWIGHYRGPEVAIRNSPDMSLLSSTAFLWGGLAKDHLGWFFLNLAGWSTALLALAAVFRRKKMPIQSIPPANGDSRDFSFSSLRHSCWPCIPKNPGS